MAALMCVCVCVWVGVGVGVGVYVCVSVYVGVYQERPAIRTGWCINTEKDKNAPPDCKHQIRSLTSAPSACAGICFISAKVFQSYCSCSVTKRWGKPYAHAHNDWRSPPASATEQRQI